MVNVNEAGESTFLRARQGQLPLSGGTIKVRLATR